jgi:phosphate:Na+ symporter
VIENLIFNLLGGLGIFLYGMKAMSEGLQALAGDRLRRIISSVTDNRVLGVGTGLLVTSIVQSSSVTTVMVVSFVNAGLMTLLQAASVILGANIGTTITGWILVLKLHNQALPILGIGVFLHLFTKRDQLRSFGQMAMGFGMVFFGLKLMESGFAPMRELPEFSALMHRFGSDTYGRLLMTIAVGTGLTILVQSSSVMLGITIAIATVGLLDFQAAAALVLGENIGTTITAQLAALNATTDARRAAMFHSVVNIFGVSVMVFLFPLWISGVDAVTPGVPDFVDATGQKPYITAHIALAHSSFNIVMTMIALPILPSIVGLVQALVRERGRQRTTLQFLRPSMIQSPALAIAEGRLEVFQMADLTREMLDLTQDLFRHGLTSSERTTHDRILKKEKITDTIQHEITQFMSRVMAGSLTSAEIDEVRSIIRLADEIESVADYCERIANYHSRLIRENAQMSQEALDDIRGYFQATAAFYEEIVEHARRNDVGWMPGIQTKGSRMVETADRIRDAHLQRLARQECDPTSGIFFSDIVVALRRIRNHSYNMAEAFLGQK